MVVVAVIAFAFLRSGADLQINGYSTHLIASVGCTLTIDDEVVQSGTLEPGEFLNYTSTYHWWLSHNATVVISAISMGGLLGSMTDTEILQILDGGTYTVNLFV